MKPGSCAAGAQLSLPSAHRSGVTRWAAATASAVTLWAALMVVKSCVLTPGGLEQQTGPQQTTCRERWSSDRLALVASRMHTSLAAVFLLLDFT